MYLNTKNEYISVEKIKRKTHKIMEWREIKELMKRKYRRNIIVSISVVLIIFGTIVVGFIYNYITERNIYSNIIKANWGIELSKDYDELYSADSGESFLGDGARYHIFKFKDIKDSNIDKSLNFKNNKDEILEIDIKSILKKLNVSQENYPDFNKEYSYYFETKGDLSKLYMMKFKESNTLYIVEDIY